MLAYTVSIPTAGNYDFSIRYAASAAGGGIQFSFGGLDKTGVVPVPFGVPGATAPTDWKEITVAEDVALESGVQNLRLTIHGSSKRFELDSIPVAPSD